MERSAQVKYATGQGDERRAVLAAAMLLVGTHQAGAQSTDADVSGIWMQFRGRLLGSEGRVVDSGQAGRTFSRHQALALQFAVRANDRPAFERMLRWTLTNMALPGRGQLVRRWASGDDVAVNDATNDTLGDLCFAWALLLAAQTWNEASFAQLARRFAEAIERSSVLQTGGRHLLLLASYGYVNQHRAVINPGVHFLPALRALSLHTRNPIWQRLSEDARQLIPQVSFSRWTLPADWVDMAPDGRVLGLARDFPARFGPEAAHIPLSLLWAGETRAVSIARVTDAWAERVGRGPPAWISLPDGGFADKAGDQGVESIARLIGDRSFSPHDATRLLRQTCDPWSALLVLAAEHVGGTLAQGPGVF